MPETTTDPLAELRATCEYDAEGESTVDALIGYKDALEDLAYAAAAAREKIERDRDRARSYFEENDKPGEWLSADGSWKDWEAEAEGREAEAVADTLDRVVAVLDGRAEPEATNE